MRQATWIQGLRAAVLLALLSNPTMAEGPGVRFEFRLEPNEVLTVDKYQDIRIFNGLAWDSREEKNRIILRVVDRREDGAVLDGQFLTYSRSPRLTGEFRQEQTFDSHFLIHKNGNYEVPEEYVMPNLQSLPSFPDRPLSPGDGWNAPAVETMDFVSVRLRLPVSVNYEYAGPAPLPPAANLGEQSFDLIRYRYSFRHRGAGNILQINGFSSCELWFDREAGIPVYDTNRLVYEFILADGSRQEFLFRIDSWYRKRRQVSVTDREEMVESIREHLPDSGNLNVRQTDEGVALDLNAILFDHDSDQLTPAARAELEHVATILSRFPGREIRISGHTDNTGTSAYNLRLSESRARTVVRALSQSNGIESRRMSYRGFGETQPIASNATPEGRARNRRVEILIVTE